MQEHEVNYHIARLFSPIHLYRVSGVNVYSKSPSKFSRYLAEIVWRDTYESAIELYNESSLVLYLVKNNIWNEKREDELNSLKDDLAEAKIQLFKNRYNDKTVELVTNKIKDIEGKIGKLLGLKHHYDHFTAEYVANQAKDRFLVGCSLYVDGVKYWRKPLEDYNKPDSLIENIMVSREHLSESEIRCVARSSQFNSLLSCKVKINYSSSEELKEVYQWANMYLTIRKHPECPEDFVFENDYMMDGWVALQKKQSEKAKLDKKANEYAQKHKQAGEIFIMAGKDISAEQIYEMNSDESKRRLKERSKYLQEKGAAREDEMPDTRREIHMQMNRSAR